MTSATPTIIVVGYNRPDSLRRLLGSLIKGHYPPGNVRLVISLDASNTPEPRKVAEAFDWPFGEKRIVAGDERKGLRKHVLSCGDLTEEYGDVIVLEDDLYVSPYFYEYATRALAYYADAEDVAGVSLYSLNFCQTANLPFIPVDNGNSDVYFLQLAASWGQAWSAKHWRGFRQWLAANGTDISNIRNIPPDVRAWPESSWLKLYNAYIIDQNKFFVYPYCALSTNFGDPGQHFTMASSRFQVAVQQQSKEHRFTSLEDSLAVYDAYCELLPRSIKRRNPKLANHEFVVNLYGHKQPPAGLQLTRTSQRGVLNFEFSMKPMELSVLNDIEGQGIALIDTSELDTQAQNSAQTEYDLYRFFYKFPSLKVIGFGIKEKIKLALSGARR
ncbi:glycosyltransferase family protein [Halopseudomonas xinjiangensis]|nr:glycosyl transferase family 2 [Halopseudomonas xinjiangensis]